MVTVIAEFNSREQAARARDALEARGISLENIGVIMRGSGDLDAPPDTRDEAEAVAEVSEDLAVEGLAEPPVGLQAAILQDMGPVFAAEPWITGEEEDLDADLLSTLGDLGVQGDEARQYCELVRQGAILLAVEAHDDQEAMVWETLEGYV